MPQYSTKPAPAKRLIDAGMPKNISDADAKALHDEWNRKAAEREAAVAKETKVPEIPGLSLRYELRKFGRHWNAYVQDGKNKTAKYTPLLNAPSLLVSAIDALNDRMVEDASHL